eukprot:TRINITY_DN17944_c0_g1_i1.p1 TRINITY_DN17944_c0_g1~~TRINITY_DN17944_c0_g1_i1.p1  ORF type:complete len:631 (+),score=224.82 TRINITY_DN17944_c0_g1_i1:38-1930(+)
MQKEKGKAKARLIVRNLSFQATPKTLSTLFGKCGTVIQVSIPEKVDGKKRGFGFVEFETLEDGKKAIEEINGTNILNRKVAVDWCLAKDYYVEYLTKHNKEKEKQQKQENEENEENEEEKEEEPENEEAEDAEGAEEGAEEDDDKEEEEEEGSKESKKKEVVDDKSKKANQQDSTLFIRNVAFDTTEDDLQAKFEEYGTVETCLLVRDPVSNRPRGTAFVQFENKEAADKALQAGYPALLQADFDADSFGKNPKVTANPESEISLDGRSLILARAVDRNKAKIFAETKKVDEKKNDDKRNFYLMKEGVIRRGDDAAEGVSDKDMTKREFAWKEKKEKMQNPNYMISTTRLSVRNLPFTLTETELKAIFLGPFRTNGENPSHKVIKSAKIVYDSESVKNGAPKSRGFAFVDFLKHEDALKALRALNNNPSTFTRMSRPIVEFAVENSRTLYHISLKREQTTKRKSAQDRTQDKPQSQPQLQQLSRRKRKQAAAEAHEQPNRSSKKPRLNEEHEKEVAVKDEGELKKKKEKRKEKKAKEKVKKEKKEPKEPKEIATKPSPVKASSTNPSPAKPSPAKKKRARTQKVKPTQQQTNQTKTKVKPQPQKKKKKSESDNFDVLVRQYKASFSGSDF